MATFDEIKEVRLLISDPFGFIDLIEVATTVDLPASPAHQTAYKVTANGVYYETSVEDSAVPDDYEKIELEISDARISVWYDAYGKAKTVCLALKQIIAQLGKQIGIARNRAGAEDVDYTPLVEMYNYYKGVLEECKEDERKSDNNYTGRWGGSKSVNIAGGSV